MLIVDDGIDLRGWQFGIMINIILRWGFCLLQHRFGWDFGWLCAMRDFRVISKSPQIFTRAPFYTFQTPKEENWTITSRLSGVHPAAEAEEGNWVGQPLLMDDRLLLHINLFSCSRFEKTFENAQWWRKVNYIYKSGIQPKPGKATGFDNMQLIWKWTVEKSQTNATTCRSSGIQPKQRKATGLDDRLWLCLSHAVDLRRHLKTDNSGEKSNKCNYKLISNRSRWR